MIFPEVGFDIEQRHEERYPMQSYVMLKPIDKRDDFLIKAMTSDISDCGMSILSYIPLPIGTHLEIDMGGDYPLYGEVVSWQWEHKTGGNSVGRMGVWLFEDEAKPEKRLRHRA
jgi:hypothetical protein